MREEGLTVGELIKLLEQMNSSSRVVHSYQSNDYWWTVVAAVVLS